MNWTQIARQQRCLQRENNVAEEIANAADPVERQRRARIWNFFCTRDFYPIYLWPAQTARIATKIHLNYQQRWMLLHFLINNGVQPALAAEWTLISGAMGFTFYPPETIRQLQHAINNFDNYNHTLRYWDMHEMEYVLPSRS